jgi:hypothetical protein
MQLANAPCPMLFSVEGSVTFLRLPHPPKADIVMRVTPLGIVTLDMDWHSANALGDMPFIEYLPILAGIFKAPFGCGEMAQSVPFPIWAELPLTDKVQVTLPTFTFLIAACAENVSATAPAMARSVFSLCIVFIVRPFVVRG